MLSLDITESNLRHCFFNEALSVKGVSKKYKCSEETIQVRIKRFGIELDSNIWYPGSSLDIRKLLLSKTSLTDKQKSILVGSILGDGCLQKNWHKGIPRRNAFFNISQTYTRVSYMDYLRNELKPFAKDLHFCKDKKGSKWYTLNTINWYEFAILYELFYPQHKKIIPSNIIEYFNELVLASWYMQDGHTMKSSSMISTQCFTLQDLKVLQNALYQRFGLVCDIKQCNGNILNFPASSNTQLHNYVDPLLHKDFLYKTKIFTAKRVFKSKDVTRGIGDRKYKEWKEKILDRDKYCIYCKEKPISSNLLLHFINYVKNDYRNDNLVIFCRSCYHKSLWDKSYQTAAQEYINSITMLEN
jgi:hypothetical protein